jgi:hypothetical protein
MTLMATQAWEFLGTVLAGPTPLWMTLVLMAVGVAILHQMEKLAGAVILLLEMEEKVVEEKR